MQELEVLLKRHDKTIEFDHLNNRIHCYPHIINICSSHIIASSTHISKKFLETLKSECGGDFVYSNIEGDNDSDNDNDNNDNDNDNNNDNNDNNNNDNNNNNNDNNNNNNGGRSFAWDIPELTLDDKQIDILDDEVRDWYTGLKRDPIKCACRIVHIVRSSDQRKQAFKDVINTGNHSGWFRSDKGEVLQVSDLELLHDVKTRWDSVYCMIKCLLLLRPVSVHMYRYPFHSYC